MSEPGASRSGRPAHSPAELVRPLVRVRQYRDFTAEPVTEAELDAIVDAARWSGSSQNGQPWRFIVLRDAAILGRVAEAGLPQTGALRNAVAAVALVLPDEPGMALVHAYDEGRAAERALAAASLVGLGAGIRGSGPTSGNGSASCSACPQAGSSGPSWRSATPATRPGGRSRRPAPPVFRERTSCSRSAGRRAEPGRQPDRRWWRVDRLDRGRPALLTAGPRRHPPARGRWRSRR